MFGCVSQTYVCKSEDRKDRMICTDSFGNTDPSNMDPNTSVEQHVSISNYMRVNGFLKQFYWGGGGKLHDVGCNEAKNLVETWK